MCLLGMCSLPLKSRPGAPISARCAPPPLHGAARTLCRLGKRHLRPAATERRQSPRSTFLFLVLSLDDGRRSSEGPSESGRTMPFRTRPVASQRLTAHHGTLNSRYGRIVGGTYGVSIPAVLLATSLTFRAFQAGPKPEPATLIVRGGKIAPVDDNETGWATRSWNATGRSASPTPKRDAS